jgi:F0F1-type ATP synthase beta subunit
VRYLLERGADPNATAFAGATPLHAAVLSGHHDLVPVLLDAGSDPDRTDEQGRRASDWAAVVTSRRARPTVEDFVETGLRSVDLFATLRRGALVHLPPAYGLGQAVALFQIADHLQPIDFWHIGFEYGAYAAWHVEHGSRETGVPVTVRLVPSGGQPTARRKAFADALAELLADGGLKVVVCQQVEGHALDVTLALPALASSDAVLATFVTEPFTGEYPPVPAALPEGFDARIAFTKSRAAAGLWPAIDPQRTASRQWPSDRHHRLSTRARVLLASYETLDPTLSLPDPSTFAVPDAANRAQSLLRYLAQPMRVAELATAIPGERSTYTELLDHIEAIIGSGDV